MIKIGVIDDGIGIFPTLYKLKQSVSANYVGIVAQTMDFCKMPKGKLRFVAKGLVQLAQQMGCDAVVFSSIDLTVASYKCLSSTTDFPLFGSEAPVNHATTYTISNVLVVGGQGVSYIRQPNVLSCVMSRFPELAQQGNQRKIVEYITQKTQDYDGQFDCIALAHSSMNLYKSCFSRVFPNVKIFDSVEGVARRVRKKYKKQLREEGELVLVDENGNDIASEYCKFLQ